MNGFIPKPVWILCGKGCRTRHTIEVNAQGLAYKIYRTSAGDWEEFPRLTTIEQSQYPSICLTHHRLMLGKPIKARLSPQTPCDARCTQATGSECTCSCGGANHGIES